MRFTKHDRARVAGLASVALLSFVSACGRAKNISGTWTTQFEGNGGSGAYVLVMSQNGSEVAGTYRGEEPSSPITPPGTFAGRLDGNVLTATWMERSGAQGWLEFDFDASARSFRGAWGNRGRPPGGSWNGTRNP